MILVRIRLLAGIFVALSFLVSLGLASLMLFEHDEWLERSYSNRWAYRDVPSRRGSVLDRRERVIRTDRPGVDLELQYWAFRRDHPLGIALHGANLYAQSEAEWAVGEGLRPSEGVHRFSFERPQTLVNACRQVLSISCADLSKGGRFEADQARDLLYYAQALLGKLSGLSGSEIIPPLRVAAREGLQISVLDAVKASLIDKDPNGNWGDFDPLPIFEQRLEQMEALAQRIHGDGKEPFDLWEFLEVRREQSDSWRLFVELPLAEREALSSSGFASFLREQEASLVFDEDWRFWLGLDEGFRERSSQAYLELLLEDEGEVSVDRSTMLVFDLPPDEARPILARRKLSYEQARWFGLLQDWHPGWILRTSVERVSGPVADLPSLEILVGRVTKAWKKDGQEIIPHRMESIFQDPAGAELSEDLEGVPAVMQASMRSSLTATLRNYLWREGRVGRTALEKEMDDVLSGRPGLRMVERDRRAREQQMFRSLQVAPGRDVIMSIDLDLQRMLEQVLVSDVALDCIERAMAIIDAQTGEILAMGGMMRSTGEAGVEELRWSRGATFPWKNPDVGSVVKPFVLLEQLDAQRHGRQVAPQDLFLPCEGQYQKDVRLRFKPLRCDGVHGMAARDPVIALAKSCNIFFYQSVEGLTADGLHRALGRVGWLGREEDGALFPEARFQGEIPGIPVNMHADPAHNTAQQVLEMQGIGYGVQVNAMQVARAYAALATGRLPRLSLIHGEAGSPVSLGVADQDLSIVQNGLRECVLSGTASRVAGFRIPGLAVHGKTGTAEISRLTKLNNAWFAGFLGRGANASIAFAAVAYVDKGHGADVGGEMIARFLARAAANPKTAEYLQR